MGSRNGGNHRLWLNDGGGRFAAASSLWTQYGVAAPAAGDIDGDPDLLLGSPRGRVLTNLTRQLTWRGLPRVGKPLTLDVQGPPGGFWLLDVSLRRAAIPTPLRDRANKLATGDRELRADGDLGVGGWCWRATEGRRSGSSCRVW